MRLPFVLVTVLVGMAIVSAGKNKRSADFLIGSTNLGGTASFGEQGVYDCMAEGKLPWKCYTEQSGINPQW
ncbi:unnamed protein product [Arctia plantaginis]|uniref:Uncharacterized protein n=1 Tax=Arctia plantaginis TaxID=874455 RepID=A0A8S1AFA8_ARCPL|nr:unnamed protein product [Arctia plantaginis]